MSVGPGDQNGLIAVELKVRTRVGHVGRLVMGDVTRGERGNIFVIDRNV